MSVFLDRFLVGKVTALHGEFSDCILLRQPHSKVACFHVSRIMSIGVRVRLVRFMGQVPIDVAGFMFMLTRCRCVLIGSSSDLVRFMYEPSVTGAENTIEMRSAAFNAVMPSLFLHP